MPSPHHVSGKSARYGAVNAADDAPLGDALALELIIAGGVFPAQGVAKRGITHV